MIMKKILMLMAITAAVISLSSCNSFENKAKNSLENEVEDSFENKAKKQLHATMKEVARNPYTDKITNEKVIFSNDSMCTISFIYKEYDDSNLGRCLGRYSQSKCEYTLVKLRKDPVIEKTTIYSSIFLRVEDLDYESEISIQKTIDYINNGFPHDLLEDVLEGDVFKLLKKTYNDNIKKGMSKEDAKANCLYIRAIANSDTYGKEITYTDGKEITL